MSRRQAKFTQADVARAIRAAKQAGATDVTVRSDGTILIGLVPDPRRENFEVEPDPEIVL
jgi:hypothetical protein